jgi:translation initiation factor IF-2
MWSQAEQAVMANDNRDLSKLSAALVMNFKGHNTPVQEAKAGDPVGVKITDRARRGDIVYKVTE